MRTYKLTIAYDGSRYQGWQRQSNTDKTIQGLLEQAASEAAGYPVEVQGSGRTDGGVHAKGQTASVILRGKVQESEFLQNMNRLLPLDIRVIEMELVRTDFTRDSVQLENVMNTGSICGKNQMCLCESIPIIIRKS